MSLDGYSLCPGGRGKKIRFCCPDMVKELDQIDSMLESRQWEAASAFVENLRKTHPDCACLLGSLCAIRRSQGKLDEYLQIAQCFYEKEPDNITARSQYINALADNRRHAEAYDLLLDTIEREEPGKFSGMVYRALYAVTVGFVAEKDFFLAIPLVKLLRTIQPDNLELNQLFFHCVANQECPVLYKDVYFYAEVPADFPERDKFQEAVRLATVGHWKKSKALMLELLPHVVHFPDLYRDLALLSYWTQDNQAGADFLDQYARAQGVKAEDASEALLLKNCLSGKLWDDEEDDLFITRTIPDFDQCLERLLSNSQFVPFPIDHNAPRPDNTPPPQKGFMILDRPQLEDESTASLETVPSAKWTMLLFGKQTDRDARAEIYEVLQGEKADLDAILSPVFGDASAAGEVVKTIRSISWTQSHLVPRFYFRTPNAISEERSLALENDWIEKKFLPAWMTRPLGILDGKTPAEAAEIPEYTIPLGAAVDMFETLFSRTEPIQKLLRFLRQRLNLSEPGPILLDQEAIKQNGISPVLGKIPMTRWGRINFSGLDSAALSVVMETAFMFSLAETGLHVATLLYDRPSDEMRIEVRQSVFDTLIQNRLAEGNTAGAQEVLARAMQEANTRNLSDGHWNILDIQLKLISGDTEGAMVLLQHVMSAHRQEQGVMAETTRLMVDLGLINPDGTPRFPNQAPSTGAPASSPAAPQESAPASGLWTPDQGNQGNQGNASGAKLWTPGS